MSNPALSYATHDAIRAFWMSATPQLALLTAAPSPDGTGIMEPSANSGYARQPVTLDVPVRANGITTVKNANALVFGPATQNDWAAVTWAALMSADGTKLLAYAPLPSQRAATVGNSLSFAVGALQFRLK